jgi:siroheme synthase
LATLATVALESEHAGFGAPSIVVIGEVAALSDKLAWFARESVPAEFVANAGD